MHLGVVLTRLAQDIDHLTHRVIGLLGPLHNLHHHLVAVTSTIEILLRYKDVVREVLVVHHQESEVLLHIKHPHKAALGVFQNLHHRALGIGALALGQQLYPHPVTIHGMFAVSLRDIDDVGIIVGDKEVLAVASSLEASLQHQAAIVDAVPATGGLQQHIGVSELVEYLHQLPATLFTAHVQGSSKLFVVVLFIVVLRKKLGNGCNQFLLPGFTFSGRCVCLSAHNISVDCFY